MRARRPDSSDGYRRRFRLANPRPSGPTPAGSDLLPAVQDMTPATWARLAESLHAPDCAWDHALAVCEGLLRLEHAHYDQDGAWALAAPAEVYDALRAHRAAYPPDLWARHLALPLIERVLPEGATFADVLAAQFVDPARAGAEAELMICAGVTAYRVGAWIALRLGGPPDLTAYPPAPSGADPS